MQYTNSHAGFWRRRWTISLTQCYNCGFAFNLWHGRLPSLAVRRDGPYWNFKCPNCKRKTAFYLQSSKSDRGQPTYSDASRTFAFLLSIPMVATLLTLLYMHMQIVNYGYPPRVMLLFAVVEETVLVANLVLFLSILWYYSHRMDLQRIA